MKNPWPHLSFPLTRLRQSMADNFKDPNDTSRTRYTRVGYLLTCMKNSLQRIYWKYKISGEENIHCVKRKTGNTYTNIPSKDCNYLGILPGTPPCGFLPILKLLPQCHCPEKASSMRTEIFVCLYSGINFQYAEPCLAHRKCSINTCWRNRMNNTHFTGIAPKQSFFQRLLPLSLLPPLCNLWSQSLLASCRRFHSLNSFSSFPSTSLGEIFLIKQCLIST